MRNSKIIEMSEVVEEEVASIIDFLSPGSMC